ncbi:MAG: hypothetical protein QOI66_4639, partial [Myxococcales bacterium]|nr:hypothetical protein [Myxococcales bacterium]
ALLFHLKRAFNLVRYNDKSAVNCPAGLTVRGWGP